MRRRAIPPLANVTAGPFFPAAFLDPDANDLRELDGQVARGTHALLTGRVLEEGGAPTINTVLEIWQADASGVFRHPLDPRFAEVDPGFVGWGRACTEQDGWYRFLTVLPGATLAADGTPRCPHINVMVLASGIMRRLVTTVFFADTPDRARDPVLDCVPGEAARRRLLAVREPALDADGLTAYRFDIVLRGEGETPFFLD